MLLSEIKTILPTLNEIKFILPNGDQVPSHFHVTEVGSIERHFIDCGGTIRKDKVINFQLWQANDFDHRLAPQKLKDIIELSENALGLEDLEIEVEYQGGTIGKYDLTFENGEFKLMPTFTDCLAKGKCGIPAEELPKEQKPKIRLSSLGAQSSCEPGSGCC